MEEFNPLRKHIVEIKRKEYLKSVPSIIYKYRTWKNEYDKNLLLKQELYFASSEQFNDPFDCNFPIAFDKKKITPDYIFIRLIDYYKNKYPEKSEFEIHKIVYDEQKEIQLNDEGYIENFAQENSKKVINLFGILSLTSDAENFLMWSHYTNSHTGFCIGFDSYKLDELCNGTFEPIRYQNEIPQLEFIVFKPEELTRYLRNILFVKSKIWSYEKEFRITINKFARKIKIFPREIVKEIILGCRMDHITKMNILKSIEEFYPECEVYEMSLHKSKFQLTKNQIK